MEISEIEALISRLSQEPEDIPLQDASLQLSHCFLLLHIYKKLESIDDSLASMSADSWDDHHNR